MKITREVNGVPVEFELTSQEMAECYWAKEFEWDKNYIVELLEYIYADADDAPAGALDTLRADPELLGRVARRWRKYVEDLYGSDAEWECLKDAYRYVTRDA